jgi:hypothetical protein
MSGDVERLSALVEAGVFLLTALERGPVPAATLFERAHAAGHALKTLRRAAHELGIRSKKGGLHDGWSWELDIFEGVR